MIFYSEKNVYEAAKDRIRYLFDEFKDRNIVVCFSGGKDSTAVLHLTKEIMDERGIKKIPVFFLDQEAEAPQTIEYVRNVMHLPWVEPYWIQSFFQEWNSSKGDWFNVWGKGEKWCREKEPGNPYTDCEYDTTRHFRDVLDSVLRYHFGEYYVNLGGVRIEESPNRRLGLTRSKCYKDITWGKQASKHSYTFYPIWDWGCNDVWYYIMSNRFEYCKLYNYYFTKKPLVKCRVSSFIHENAIKNLKEIKDIAPQFYSAALKRIENINSTVQSLDMLSQYVTGLPKYFKDWDEYIEYLATNIIEDKANTEVMLKSYRAACKKWRTKFAGYEDGLKQVNETLGSVSAICIVREDTEMSALQNCQYGLSKLYKDYHDRIKESNKGQVPAE
jgi:predicted phosphoadenosine phosphosulfate sulfurtransferase